MRRIPIPLLLLLAPLLSLAGCDNTGTDPSADSVLVVRIDRLGNGTDADGVTIDVGTRSWTLPLDSTLVLRDLAAGTATVEMSGLAGHCAADTTARTLGLQAGDSADVNFTVECYGGFAYGLWFNADNYEVRYLGEDGRDIALTGVTGRNFPRDWSPDGNTLLVESTASGNDDIWVVNRDGSELHPLLEHPYVEVSPRWSPAGDWIVFERFPSWGEVPWTALYMVRPDGSEEHVLLDTANVNTDPAWSPDDGRVLFRSSRFGTPMLVTVDANGANLQAVVGGRMPSWPSFSPDGSKIAYIDWVGDVQDAWVIGADGASPRNVSGTDQTVVVLWSPDGDDLLFSAGAGESEIYRVAPDGTALVNLTASPGMDEQPAWSPDGSRILFSSARDGVQDIYIMDRDGGHVRRLHRSTATGVAYAPLWNPGARPGAGAARSAVRAPALPSVASAAVGIAGCVVRELRPRLVAGRMEHGGSRRVCGGAR